MAINTNVCILVGHLTRDMEVKYLNNGTPVGAFSLAVNDRYKKGEEWVDEVSFFDVTLWGKSAESLLQYLLKGKMIAVTGKLKQDRWEQDGQSRSKVKITADRVELLGGGGDRQQGGGDPSGGSSRSAPSGTQGSRQGPPAQPPTDDFSDDIPF